jgi:SAM-dependent methyltransferase
MKLLRLLARSIEQRRVHVTAVRLFRSLRNYGISGTLEGAFFKAPRTVTCPFDSFDLEHGTDTGIVSEDELSTNTLSGLYATFHVAVPPSAFIEAISQLPLAHEAFTFVDIGCGKGRALMLASAFPFRRLVGVEISPEFCEIARANTARRPDWSERIFVINQDAVQFTFPDGPLLIFLYNPFTSTILRRVLSSLERQLRRAPREAYLIYGDNPHYEKVLQQFPFLRQIAESKYDLSPKDTLIWIDANRKPVEIVVKELFTLYRADTPA